MKYVGAFLFFWWDFIVGDSIILAFGAVLTLGATYTLAHAVSSVAAEIVLPAGVLATLGLALRRS